MIQITAVKLFEVRGRGSLPNWPAGNRQAMSIDIYPDANARDWSQERTTGLQELRAAYVEIQTNENVSGIFGPIEPDQVFVIIHYLRPFLLNRDPLAIECLHDQMLRLNRHGRSGLFMNGISAVDCALWDLKGKVWQQPIYRILGGPTRPSVPAYASMLGFSIDPEQASSTAVQYKEMGYPAQKWFFRYGPADGQQGLEQNIALAQSLRDALGEHYPIMFDAFMGWDMPYATEMQRELEAFHPTWLEEPFPPERVSSFARLKQISNIPLATGEHVYTRWQVRELLNAGAVDYLQNDPDWTGGISELVKIAALCSAFDTPLVAHGHSLLAALHVAGSQSSTVVPYIEFLIQHQAHKQHFHVHQFEPENGRLLLPTHPGLGIILDDKKIEQKLDLG